MARNRKKNYTQGDRINIYLSRELTPEFVEWINKQSDLSNFFLYAVQQLYSQTGFIDVSEVMPRKINFDLGTKNTLLKPTSTLAKPETDKIPLEDSKELKEPITEEKNKEKWSNVSDIEDNYA